MRLLLKFFLVKQFQKEIDLLFAHGALFSLFLHSLCASIAKLMATWHERSIFCHNVADLAYFFQRNLTFTTSLCRLGLDGARRRVTPMKTESYSNMDGEFFQPNNQKSDGYGECSVEYFGEFFPL